MLKNVEFERTEIMYLLARHTPSDEPNLFNPKLKSPPWRMLKKRNPKSVSPFLLAPGMLVIVIVVIIIRACKPNCGRYLIIDHHVWSPKSSSVSCWRFCG